MKKFASIILVLALALSLSVPAFAEGDTVSPGDKVEVKFTYAVSEPKFTVEIPATIELELDAIVNLPVTVSGGATETLDGRKIAITLEDALNGDEPYYTNPNHDFLLVQNNDAPEPYHKALMYYVRLSGGSFDNRISSFEGKNLEFTEDGTKDIQFHLPSDIMNFDKNLIYPNSRYTGWVVFGVKIVSETPIEFSKYDLNKDGVVDGTDFDIAKLYLGIYSDDPDWETLVLANDVFGNGITPKMCDINGDGVINEMDLVEIAAHFTD